MTIVQIISLPVSFLSLARAFVVADEVFHYDDRRNNELNMRNKLVHFATNLLVLSSRLFAAALVTANYNTGMWVFFIFAFHYIPILNLKCVLVSLHVSGKDREGGIYLKSFVYVFLFHWPIQDQTIIYPRFIMLQSRRDYYTSHLCFFSRRDEVSKHRYSSVMGLKGDTYGNDRSCIPLSILDTL